jgi:hypothetical protein
MKPKNLRIMNEEEKRKYITIIKEIREYYLFNNILTVSMDVVFQSYLRFVHFGPVHCKNLLQSCILAPNLLQQ